MVDNLKPEHRKKAMSRVQQQNTKPEITVRKMLHRNGFRFRLHNKTLPGTPDIVLLKYKTVIFVHGCFWHQHEGCRKARRPTSNVEFWNEKLDKNIARDNQKEAELKKAGWRVLYVWECELKDTNPVEAELIKKLLQFG